MEVAQTVAEVLWEEGRIPDKRVESRELNCARRHPRDQTPDLLSTPKGINT